MELYARMRQHMEKLHLGLIGAGWISPYHMQGWRSAHDLAEVVAVADPSA